jgi:hypothetical protein
VFVGAGKFKVSIGFLAAFFDASTILEKEAEVIAGEAVFV